MREHIYLMEVNEQYACQHTHALQLIISESKRNSHLKNTLYVYYMLSLPCTDGL